MDAISDEFESSFSRLTNPSIISTLDQWTLIAVKSVNLGLAFIALLQVILSFLVGAAFTIPELAIIGLAVFGFIITAIFDISYRIQIARRRIYSRIKYFLLGIYGLIVGVPFGVFFALYFVIQDFVVRNLVLAFGLVISLLTAYVSGSKISSITSYRLLEMLKPPYRPFHSFLSRRIFHNILTLRTIASVILLVAAVIYPLASLSPDTLFLIPFAWFIFLASWFLIARDELPMLRFGTISSYGNMDVATFIFQIVSCMKNGGISHFEVHMESEFDSTYSLIFSTRIDPFRHEPIRVVHSYTRKTNPEKIQSFLSENWGDDWTYRPHGPASCPFYSPTARILIDSELLKATRLLWTPTSELAIVIEPSSLDTEQSGDLCDWQWWANARDRESGI